MAKPIKNPNTAALVTGVAGALVTYGATEVTRVTGLPLEATSSLFGLILAALSAKFIKSPVLK